MGDAQRNYGEGGSTFEGGVLSKSATPPFMVECLELAYIVYGRRHPLTIISWEPFILGSAKRGFSIAIEEI